MSKDIFGIDDLPHDIKRELFEGQRELHPVERSTESDAKDIAALREFLKVYSAPITFKAGDIVTPRATSHMNGIGEPFIVLEVNNDARPLFDVGDPGRASFGDRPQLRVAKVCSCQSGGAKLWWVEAHEFELWSSPETPSAPNA